MLTLADRSPTHRLRNPPAVSCHVHQASALSHPNNIRANWEEGRASKATSWSRVATSSTEKTSQAFSVCITALSLSLSLPAAKVFAKNDASPKSSPPETRVPSLNQFTWKSATGVLAKTVQQWFDVHLSFWNCWRVQVSIQTTTSAPSLILSMATNLPRA